MLKRVIAYFLPLLCCIDLPAQQAKQFVFTQFNRTSGVASNYVNNIVQDSKGYMWAATINGLQRYDGNKFITFRNEPGNPHSLPSENIAFVYTDKAKNLWVATGENKVGIFNTGNFRFREVAVNNNMSRTIYTPKQFFETNDGRLMLLVRHMGLYVLDTVTKAFVPARHYLPVPMGWSLNSVAQDSRSGVFYMASDSGLAVYDPAVKQLSYRSHNAGNNPVVRRYEKEKYVLEVVIVSGNSIFLTIWPPTRGFPCFIDYDVLSDRDKPYNLSVLLKMGYHEFGGSLQQRNGRIWLYGKPFLTVYTRGSDHPFEPIRNEYKNEQGIRFDQVNSMYEDRENNLWICTNNGIFLFNPDEQPFSAFHLVRTMDKEQAEGPVVTALQLQNGQTWIGCWGLGLYCYGTDLNPVPVPGGLRFVAAAYSIWCMRQHRETGVVWMGLQGGSIITYDPASGKTNIAALPVFAGSTIRQMTEDKAGNLWFGTQNGSIIKWDRKLAGNDPGKGYTVVTRKGRVYKLLTDSKGMIWAACLGFGIIQIDPATTIITAFTSNGPPGMQLSTDAPTDLIEYNDSLIMIANHSVDVLNTRTNRIYAVNTSTGLPSNNVLCLEKDRFGMVWLGMVNGLCRMNFRQQMFTTYDRSDGITYDNFNEAGAFHLSGGRLLFATEHSFLVFDPEKLVRKSKPPDVHITDFIMQNRSLPVDSLTRLKRISLDFSKNSVIIEFNLLIYLRQNKMAYYYQLEGIDKGWVRSDERHRAIYNYIPPGVSTFRVKCVNGYGISSGNITTLQLNIQPPFYRTWWFYGILILIAAAVLYQIDKERFRRIITLQQVRSQIAFNLHQDISTTLNNIHLLSEIAKIKADKDLDKSKEYIDQINSKSRKMIDDMNDMLWSIDPVNDNIQKPLEKMQEFAEGLKNRHGCRIDMVVDEQVQLVKLDMKTRHEILFIFKEALNNIVQHSNCTSSIIHVDLIRSALCINIHDNGSGFDIKSIQNSHGIFEMEKRARELKAVLDIQSDKKGTSLILQVPV